MHPTGYHLAQAHHGRLRRQAECDVLAPQAGRASAVAKASLLPGVHQRKLRGLGGRAATQFSSVGPGLLAGLPCRARGQFGCLGGIARRQ
jgi:hypothetical protein